MSTLDLLARRCLVTWLYRIVMQNTLSAVFNGNRNISCWCTSKCNRLWCISLAIFQNPACRDLSFGRNGLIRLARYIKDPTINWIATLVHVSNLQGLIISRVININSLVSPISDLVLIWCQCFQFFSRTSFNFGSVSWNIWNGEGVKTTL